MDLEKLLKKIKEVENDISILESLKAVLGEKDENERCAGISYRDRRTVYFKPLEVNKLLQQRYDGLHVQLNRLLAAKEAAEKTLLCLLNEHNRT